MAEQLTASAVEWWMWPDDEAVHAFWSARIAAVTRGPIRAWCGQLVRAELLEPTLGELCTSCRLVFRVQMPGCELPRVGE